MSRGVARLDPPSTFDAPRLQKRPVPSHPAQPSRAVMPPRNTGIRLTRTDSGPPRTFAPTLSGDVCGPLSVTLQRRVRQKSQAHSVCRPRDRDSPRNSVNGTGNVPTTLTAVGNVFKGILIPPSPFVRGIQSDSRLKRGSDRLRRKTQFGLSDGSPLFELALCILRRTHPKSPFAHAPTLLKPVCDQVVAGQEEIGPDYGRSKCYCLLEISNGTRA